MKRALPILMAFGLFLFNGEQGWSADFQKGLTAYETKDYGTALQEWLPLAKQGNAEAQHHVGMLYLMGLGITNKNRFMATQLGIEWIKRASNQNYPDALSMMASFFERGEFGFNKDVIEAFKLRKKASETGDGLAIYNLAQSYLNGEGVKPNRDIAMLLFKKAASKNIQAAMFNLGVMYGTVEKYKNLKNSYMWFDLTSKWTPDDNVSSHLGNLAAIAEKVKNIKIRLEEVLSPQDVQFAKDLARQCVRKKYKEC
jgi:uncharacterized protein